MSPLLIRLQRWPPNIVLLLGHTHIQTVVTQGLCQVAPQSSSKTSLLGLALDYGQKHHLFLYLLLC